MTENVRTGARRSLGMVYRIKSQERYCCRQDTLVLWHDVVCIPNDSTAAANNTAHESQHQVRRWWKSRGERTP